MTQPQTAKFGLGQIVRHREESFRGVVVDVDAVYAGAAHEPGPDHRGQPFYRVLAMGEGAGYLIYAAEAVLSTIPTWPCRPTNRPSGSAWMATATSPPGPSRFTDRAIGYRAVRF